MSIQIKFTGHSGIRKLGNYVWNSENNYVQEVDVETAANLITYPNPGQFALVANQKLSKVDSARLEQLIGAKVEVPSEPEVIELPPTLSDVDGLSEARVRDLSEANVPDLAALAGLNEAAVKAVARKTGATRKEIQGWVEQAKTLLK